MNNSNMDLKKIIRQAFLIPVYLYKGLISPFAGPSCRYIPSCSSYFVEAVLKYGVIKGTILGVSRLTRCSGRYLGGPDPVPEKFSFKEIRDNYKRYRKRRT